MLDALEAALRVHLGDAALLAVAPAALVASLAACAQRLLGDAARWTLLRAEVTRTERLLASLTAPEPEAEAEAEAERIVDLDVDAPSAPWQRVRHDVDARGAVLLECAASPRLARS